MIEEVVSHIFIFYVEHSTYIVIVAHVSAMFFVQNQSHETYP